MNANELADKLEQGHWEGGTREQAATMLRQQQAEIDALKGLIEVLRMGQPNIDYDKELLKPTFVGRELTDDELFKVYADLEEVYTGNNFPVDLGRAILRKAQEK